MDYGLDPETCQEACSDYPYFALQNNGWCVCGYDYGNPRYVYPQILDEECDKINVGMGGPWANAVYENLDYVEVVVSVSY